MSRYVKGVLGGLLAILAAFGWMVTVVFILLFKFSGEASGYGISARILNSPVLWILLTVIFAIGFYRAFRAVY